MTFLCFAFFAHKKIAPGWLARVFGGASFLFLALFPQGGFAQSLLLDTTFQDSSATGWILPDTGNGQATLTSGNPDPAGQGWLELTPNPVANNRTGFAYDTQQVALSAGIDIKIQYQTWGGGTNGPPANAQGADGIALDLFSPTLNPTAGGYGGSLGYAQETITSGTTSTLVPGLTGGILGIGIDEKGNFAQGTQSRVPTGTPAKSNSITLRGPGSGSGATVGTAPNYGLLGTAKITNSALSIQTGGIAAASRPTAAASLRFAEFKIDTTQQAADLLPVTVILTNGTAGVSQTFNFDIYAQMKAFYGLQTGSADLLNLPPMFQIGFTSSTGAQVNVHDIRNVTVTSLNSLAGFSPVDAGAPIVDFVGTGLDTPTSAAETTTNWNFGATPLSTDDVFVNNGVTAVLSSALSVKRLDLAAVSGVLTANGFTIQGGGSLVVNTDVTVGENAIGVLNVGSTGNGIGSVTDVNGIIGEFSGATGTATVRAGSTWTNSGDLMVGGILAPAQPEPALAH